jgi:hypothetical protein
MTRKDVPKPFPGYEFIFGRMTRGDGSNVPSLSYLINPLLQETHMKRQIKFNDHKGRERTGFLFGYIEPRSKPSSHRIIRALIKLPQKDREFNINPIIADERKTHYARSYIVSVKPKRGRDTFYWVQRDDIIEAKDVDVAPAKASQGDK